MIEKALKSLPEYLQEVLENEVNKMKNTSTRKVIS